MTDVATRTAQTKPKVRPADPMLGRIVGAFALLVVAAAITGLAITGSTYEPSAAGLADAGPMVGWGLPLVSALGLVTAICTIGWLLMAAFLDPEAGDGHVSRRGRTAILRASVASLLCCVFALIAAVFTLASALGVPLSTVVRPEAISTYAWDITSVRALIVSALLALVVAIGCLFTARLTTATCWLVLAVAAVVTPKLTGHAAGLGNHEISLVSIVTHVVAASLWVGGVMALGLLAFSVAKTNRQLPTEVPTTQAPTMAIAAARFSPLALACVAALLISGILSAYARVGDFADLFYTGYGQVVLAKSALLLALIGAGLVMRQRILPTLSGSSPRTAFARLAAVEISLMAIATGLGVALSQSPPTRAPLVFASQGESLLGFEFPPAPTFANVMLGWHFDPVFMTVGVVGAAFYIAGVLRLRARGDKWPVARTISFLLGMALLVWGTNAGIAAYSEMSVGIHMIQHMTLVMMVPIPIVLGGPVTLALRAIHPSPTGGRGPRELINTTLHSKVAQIYTNPFVVLAIYGSGAFGLYFSGLFGFLMGSHIGHIIMTVHFLATGLLLCYIVIGIDPKPRPIPYWARLVLIMATMVLHTFFAVALMSTVSAIGSTWYELVQPPWLLDTTADSVLGGQIAWAIGEIPMVLMMLIVAVQWSRSDTREAKRRDRFTSANGDLELDSYNDYLAHLNELSQNYESRRRGEEPELGEATEPANK